MDSIADQRLAQVVCTLRLVNFKLLQLRHTNDQLQAGLADLIDEARRAAPQADAPPPTTSLRKGSSPTTSLQAAIAATSAACQVCGTKISKIGAAK